MSPEDQDFGVSPCSEQASEFLFRLDEGRKTKGKYSPHSAKTPSSSSLGKGQKALRRKERKLKSADKRSVLQQQQQQQQQQQHDEASPYYDFIESFQKKEKLKAGTPETFVLSLESSSEEAEDAKDEEDDVEDHQHMLNSSGYSKRGGKIEMDSWKDVTYTDELRLKSKQVIETVVKLKKLAKEMTPEVLAVFEELCNTCEALEDCVNNDEASYGYQRNWSGEPQDDTEGLMEDFQHTAELYGKIIVSEKQLQPRYKTIKTATEKLGGLYGGEKYLHHGLLFKFSEHRDARKAPSHELKALRKVGEISKKSKGLLHTPLFTVIHYKGFTISAQTVVPINQKTLVYGSSNGGDTVVNEDSNVHRIVCRSFKEIGLVAHLSGITNRQTICGPADMEVHRGNDGRLWVIDLHRLSPPTSARNFLQELFRFEFLEEYHRKTGKMLSSDAFSIFGGDENDDQAVQHNSAVKEAVVYLKTVHIPAFVQSYKADSECGKELVVKMHKAGINVRFCGLVWNATTSSRLRTVLEIEMAARSIKRMIYQAHSKITTPLTSLSRHIQVCVDILNNITKRENFAFFVCVCRRVRKIFEGMSKLDSRTFQENLMSFRPLSSGLLLRLCEICGIILRTEKKLELCETEPYSIEFSPKDIVDVKPIVKVSW